ncbi:hypothetical protein [Pseudomonas protegens]|uniref:hypothetical protein n=1 Tax=Pseudomonas protegens TaxID=380021 RepID=UPI00382082B8
MHKIDVFRKEFQQYSSLNNPDAKQVSNFASWLEERGIPLFKEAFKQETNRPIPSLPDEKLIEQAYPKGLNEIDKKQLQQTFYVSNAQIFVQTCSWIASTVVNASSDPRAEVFSSRHFDLLHYLVLDAMVLLDDWAHLTQDVPAMYGIGKNAWHSASQIALATDQLIFSGSPFFAFTDNSTDSGIALLRIALETRMRFGFGLLGVVELSTQSVLPLNLSTVFKAIDKHQHKFKLAVPLQHIERIYGWSNIYVHIGLKHFMWSPIFALRYMNRLLRGGEYSKGFSVNAGIEIDKATLLAIQDEAETAYNLDSTKYELSKIPVDQCAVVLTA